MLGTDEMLGRNRDDFKMKTVLEKLADDRCIVEKPFLYFSSAVFGVAICYAESVTERARLKGKFGGKCISFMY